MTKLCSICGEKLDNEWGNNAQPVNDGKCCNDCNKCIVIPERLKRFQIGGEKR